MNIAGVQFRLESDNAFWSDTLSAYPPSFAEKTGTAAHGRVTYRVVEAPMPDVRGLECLSVDDEPWTLYDGKEAGYIMVFRHAGYGRVFWSARIDKDGRSADLFFSDEVPRFSFPPSSRPLDELLLTLCLASRNGGLVHGTGVGMDGQGLVFIGPSGAGKSTLARLFKQAASARVLSDERVVIRKNDAEHRIYGTPWHSDAYMAANLDFPLKALFYLHHGSENRIVPCPTPTAVQRLIPQVRIPWYDPRAVFALLDFCGSLLESVPAYDFFFTPHDGAVFRLMDFLGGGHDSY